MNLLDIFLAVSGVIIFILSIDIAKRQKFNAVHFFVFILIGVALLTFVFVPSSLNFVGRMFGLQRGADLLVYSSIIFLIYISLVIIRKLENDRSDLTKIVREIAIFNSQKKEISGKVVFVIPAYNEGKVIGSTLDNLIKNGYSNIVVINDGSKDNSIVALEKFSEQIIILSHLQNRGQGAALETGFEYLRRYGEFQYVCTYDSDGQHDVEDIEKFIVALEDHPKIDMIFGSRFLLKQTSQDIPFLRKVTLKLGKIFTLFFSNISLTDTHNGFRMFRFNRLNDIKISIDTMGHASEIIDIVATRKIPYKEVPVHIHYNEYTLSKGQKSSNALNIAVRFLWNKFFR